MLNTRNVCQGGKKYFSLNNIVVVPIYSKHEGFCGLKNVSVTEIDTMDNCTT